MRPLLGDPDPAVRIAAIQSLGNDSMSLDQRRAILMDHSQPVKVRAAAIKSLMSYDEKFPDAPWPSSEITTKTRNCGPTPQPVSANTADDT